MNHATPYTNPSLSLDTEGNVTRPEYATQVAVLRGCLLEEEEISAFEAFFAEKIKTRVTFLEVVLTNPDLDDLDGYPIEGTGRRSDILFAVHQDDVRAFDIKLLGLQDPPSWIEDALQNSPNLYPSRLTKYRTQ